MIEIYLVKQWTKYNEGWVRFVIYVAEGFKLPDQRFYRPGIANFYTIGSSCWDIRHTIGTQITCKQAKALLDADDAL